ncbi:MAG: hypothetical protein RL199_368 [Pseudomonadota bacterium]|jgi:hypothetical protein
MERTTQNDTVNEVEGREPATPELDARTRRLVEKSIVRVNGLVAEAGGKYDAIADHLFETYYDGDVQRALTPAKDTPAGIAALAREADGALRVGRTMLFSAVRVGALNRRLARTAWSGLGWTVKTELLPLLGGELSYERLSAGAVHASKTKATIREARAYVAQQLATAAEQGTVDQPRTGPGFPAGRKALALTAAMGKAADRRRWVDRYVALPADEQAELLNAVRASLRNLEKLAAEFAAAVDDV